MRITADYHLTYCTNIHPGQDWETTFASLKRHVPTIKEQVSNDTDFGLGLRLSNKASAELGTGERLETFRDWLQENRLYVFTMNGFPYGNFHDERVKDQVHAPDWTTPERLIYTKRLFDQLAILLPNGMEGGISTSPISYRHWYPSDAEKHGAFIEGAKNLTKTILHLYRLEAETGKYMHLDIEPEPDGMLENSDEVVVFFRKYLIPVAKPLLIKELGKSHAEATELIHRYITVCYDICHFSLAYEEPTDTFSKLDAAGIQIGKIQVSAALKMLSETADDKAIWEALAAFDEPTYLHQVTEKSDSGVRTFQDLPEVLQAKKPFDELRAHFHVPIFLDRFGPLFSTQDHILKVVKYLQHTAVTRHLEIETYTWDVLPTGLKRDLSESIIREIEWFRDVM